MAELGEPTETPYASRGELLLTPLTLKEANQVVGDWHRHNRPTTGGKFAVGVQWKDSLVAVAIVGRPVARMLNDPFTAEVLRTCCVPAAPRNCNSVLYSACWRAWRAMGGRRLVTYTLMEESGSSLRGAGWTCVAEIRGHSEGWSRPSRKRDYQPIYGQQKLRWERSSGEVARG